MSRKIGNDQLSVNRPSRRDVLQTTAAAGLTATAAPGLNLTTQAQAGTQKKPNILVIVPDQYRFNAMDSAGFPGMATPHLDKLAAQGTRFETTWVQSPVCRPSRLSMISGLYVNQHGRKNNIGPEFDPNSPTMMKALQKAGYTTATFGKTDYDMPEWLVKGGLLGLKDSHFDSRSIYPYLQKFGWDVVHDNSGRNRDAIENYNSEYTDFLRQHGWLEIFQWQVRGTRDEAAKNGSKWIPTVSLLPQEAESTSFLANQVMDFLNAHDESKPFFLHFGPHSPHLPLMCDAEWAAYYVKQDVPLGPRDLPRATNPIWQNWLDLWLKDSDSAVLDDDMTKTCMRMYFGMCSLVDQKVGDIVALLQKRGMLDNTWIIFLSDHGEMLGDHHFMGKMMFYKGSVQIPGIVRPPKKPAQAKVSQPVEMIDMTATILDIAGAAPLPDSYGASVLPALSGKALPKEAAFSEAYQKVKGVEMEMVAVRTADYRYTMERNTKTPCEFFDMKNDPDEIKNLVDDATMRTRIGEHQGLIEDYEKLKRA